MIYAIGDIHGQLEMLRGAHDLIAKDRAQYGEASAPVVHLGDLNDRGPDSRGVIQLLINGIAAGQPWVVIRGNHDRMFAGYLANRWHHDPHLRAELPWRHERLGGLETLASYGVDGSLRRNQAEVHAEALAAVPVEHIEFLNERPLWHVTDDQLFVHAGIRPGIAIESQAENDLVWIRDGFLDDTRDHGRLVVHGHTVVDTPTNYGNRVNLDTGAGYFHPLSVAVFEGQNCFILTARGRVALPPV